MRIHWSPFYQRDQQRDQGSWRGHAFAGLFSLVFVILLAVPQAPPLIAQATAENCPTPAAAQSGPATFQPPTNTPTNPMTEARRISPTPCTAYDVIRVNSYVQEIDPFVVNGNCTFGEAIQAVNTRSRVDECHGESGATTIILQVGTYKLKSPNPRSANARYQNGLPILTGNAATRRQLTLVGNNALLMSEGEAAMQLLQVAAGTTLYLRDLRIEGSPGLHNEGTIIALNSSFEGSGSGTITLSAR